MLDTYLFPTSTHVNREAPVGSDVWRKAERRGEWLVLWYDFSNASCLSASSDLLALKLTSSRHTRQGYDADGCWKHCDDDQCWPAGLWAGARMFFYDAMCRHQEALFWNSKFIMIYLYVLERRQAETWAIYISVHTGQMCVQQNPGPLRAFSSSRFHLRALEINHPNPLLPAAELPEVKNFAQGHLVVCHWREKRAFKLPASCSLSPRGLSFATGTVD